MRFPLSRALLGLLLLSAPAGAVKLEVPAGEIRAGGVGNAAEAGARVQPVQLSVLPLNGIPSLGPGPSSLGITSVGGAPRLEIAPAVALAPAPHAAAHGASPRTPLAAAAPAALSPTAGPRFAPESAAADAPSAGSPAAEAAGLASREAPLDGQAHAGSVRFDGASRRESSGDGVLGGGWRSVLQRLLPARAELVPAWPGAAGETVRLGGKRYVLKAVIGQGGGSTVWSVERDGEVAIKLLQPQHAALAHYGDEASILKAIRNNPDIPHARLIAASTDGRVMVKERLSGVGATERLERKGFDRIESKAWGVLAAKLIRAGADADLIPSNLQYSWRESRWVLLDAGGVRDGRPAGVLSKLLAPSFVAQSKLDLPSALRGMRDELGAGSALWKELGSQPLLADGLAALAAEEAAAAARREALPKPALKDRFWETAELGAFALGLQLLAGILYLIAGAHASHPLLAGAFWALGASQLIARLAHLRGGVTGGWQASHDQKMRTDYGTGKLRDVRGHKYGEDRYDIWTPGPTSPRARLFLDGVSVLFGLPWVLGGGLTPVALYLASALSIIGIRRWRDARAAATELYDGVMAAYDR